MLCSCALFTKEIASGWLEPISIDAVRRSNCSSVTSNGTTSVTCGLPCVNVPVLSKATDSTRPNSSSAAPPLISAPRFAAAAKPEVIAAGVEITKAHGHAINSNAKPRYTHVSQG